MIVVLEPGTMVDEEIKSLPDVYYWQGEYFDVLQDRGDSLADYLALLEDVVTVIR